MHHIHCCGVARACGAGKLEAVKALLQDQRTRLEDRDGEGSTPLLVAASSGRAPVALYLASLGADLEVSGTPLGSSDFMKECRSALSSDSQVGRSS